MRSTLGVAILLASSASALAQRQPEHPDMPPGTPGPLHTSIPATRSGPRGEFQSVQVNVTKERLNILGDAGNELSPSISPWTG